MQAIATEQFRRVHLVLRLAGHTLNLRLTLPTAWLLVIITLLLLLALAAALAFVAHRRVKDAEVSRRKLEREIADRKRTGDALRQSEAQYRLLFQANPQPMWVYSRDDLRFLAVNNAAIESYGYSESEFFAMTLRDIRPAEDIPKLVVATSIHDRQLQHGGLWRHQTKQGKLIDVEITEHAIVFSEHPAYLVMASDVTERLKLEERLRRAEKLDSIGRLAGGIAHDFNNLLTVINGFGQMALDELPDDALARDSIKEVLDAGHRAAALTNQLLTFGRKQLVRPTVVSLNNVVHDMQPMLRRLIREDVRLITRLSPELGNTLIDEAQVQQILINLSVNARDAMPTGGTLIIETANAVLDEAFAATHPEVRPGAYVMVVVTDTGEGMTPEVRTKIFEPFFTTKDKGKGTGLGLATVYGVVKQADGFIWVYSEPGKGASFRVYLPRTDQPVHVEVPEIKLGQRGTETILIVEDQRDVRRFASAALRNLGYTIYEADSPAAALTFCGEFSAPIHLLLTDVVMPDMNGPELASRILALRPTTNVLYMSGYTDNAITESGVLDPGLAYLQKPFTSHCLGEKVRSVLGARPSSNEVILVIDDDERVRRLLGQTLINAGFGVVEAANGRHGRTAIQNNRIDLVISDIVMPEEEGLEFLQSLQCTLPNVPAIAISGAFEGQYLRMAAKFGAAAALPKPIDREVLLKTVRKLLSAAPA
ncbi:MAG TPA: response regulator [Candidatus Limnocylindrales bacterium]|nr:response regulator [Candidatus Limnocylindrales bacterium]